MRFPRTAFLAALIGLATFALIYAPRLIGAEESVKPKTFIYVLRLAPKFQDESAWTKEDHAIAQRHFQRLKAAAENGPVILAGRTEEPADKTFGIVIFEAPDEKAARVFMQNDPAVKNGLMTAELHPYMVAVQRSAQGVTTR
jgi:uncharacterized protein YciI